MVLVAKPKRPNAVHHKKRVGAHHRHTKDYTRHYWPYLPLAAIVGLGLLANVVWSQRSGSVLGASTDVSASELLSDTNTQRLDDHESPLLLNDRLTSAAQAKADDMVARNYWSHDTPDGQTPWTFITAAGYSYASAGENLAYGFSSSSALTNGWMNSPEHRANILNQHFSQVGFGVARSPNFQKQGPETVVVAMYAEPAVVTAGARLPATPTSSASVTSPASRETQPAAQRVARVQAFSASGASWSLFVVSLFGASAVIWFMLRHALAWRRTIVHGEEFIVRHQFLDVVIVSVATLGFVLTRTAGFIH
jgi:Cysteine-rich secretory protein family